MRLVKASESLPRSLVVSGIAFVAVASALAGCTASSGAAASTPPAIGGSVPAAAHSTSTGGTTATTAQPRALCSGLPAADVAALFTVPVGPVQLGSGSVTCTYAPAGKSGVLSDELSVVIDPVYGSATYPNTAGSLGASPQPISGVGDKAVWALASAGYGSPSIVALKGKTSCYLQPPSDTAVLTLVTTDGRQVTDAAAAAYAQKLGVLCADIFSGK